VILYADVMTASIKKFLAVTEYRRRRQMEYNQQHNITPRSVSRALEESLATYETKRDAAGAVLRDANVDVDIADTIQELEQQMLAAAEELQFEKAALFRDQIKELKRMMDGSQTAGETRARPVSYSKKARRHGAGNIKSA
jgi:excinuclease ABC subunit B